MMPRFGRSLLGLLLLLPFLGGCLMSREISSLQRDIAARNSEIDMRRNFVLNVGGGSLYMLERLVQMVDHEELNHASEYLHYIDRLKVGIYDVRIPDDAGPLNLIDDQLLDRNKWERAIAVRDERSAFVLVHPRDAEHIRDLFLFSASDDQLVILKFQGDAGRIVSMALADRHRFAETWRVPLDGASEADSSALRR